MITIEWDKKSLNEFDKKIGNLLKNLSKYAENGVNRALEETQQYALEQKYGTKDENKIRVEKAKQAKIITGRVYTDKDTFDYASFMEYGTGEYAELQHIGVTQTFYESDFKYWYLPTSKAKEPLKNKIVYIHVRDSKGQWTGETIECYLMTSQRPKPFMRTTAFDRLEPNVNTVKEEIKKGIEVTFK